MLDNKLSQRDPTQGGFHLNLIEEGQMTPAKDAAIRQLLCVCFPEDAMVFGKTRYWHGSGPAFSLTEESQGVVRGHVGVVVRAVTCGGHPLTIGGIQSLAVLPELRGRGLSRMLMEQSMIEARRRGLTHGLLFCAPALRKFYESVSWFTVDASVTMLDEQGAKTQLPEKNICLAKNLAAVPFPAGDMDLQGADW